MKPYLGTCLSLALSLVTLGFVTSAAVFAQTTTTSSTGNDMLDDQGEQQLQAALNDIYNKYNPQISGIQTQIDQLNATGLIQCKSDQKSADTQAQQTEDQAKMQALQQMMGPGAQTLGHVIDAGMKGMSGEKAEKTAQIQRIIENCNSSGTLICDNTGASPAPVTDKNCPQQSADTTGQKHHNCQVEAQSEATRYTTQISSLQKEIKDTSTATDGLISSGMQLAAAGLGGMLMNKQAAKSADYMRDAAKGSEQLCEKQLQQQIAALNNQINQLQAAKARDLLMANMQAEYGTKNRRAEKPAEVDNTTKTGGGSIDVGSATPFDPNAVPVRTAPMTSKGSGGGGSGGGAGGGSAGGGGAPAWDFGGGSGFDGGSRLPDQPDAVGYGGSGTSAANVPKAGNGFGNMDGKKEEKGPEGEGAARDVATDGTPVLGDGGLRVLLARASLVHTRHASTLLKSIDFDRLAKSQGITPKPASVSPAGPN